jgi:hypothetical protein
VAPAFHPTEEFVSVGTGVLNGRVLGKDGVGDAIRRAEELDST